MPRTTETLAALYLRFLERQGAEWCREVAPVCRKRQRTVRRLGSRGIVTVADLLARFSGLTSRLKFSAMDLIAILEIRQAVPVLLAAMSDASVRVMSAAVVGQLDPGRRATRVLLQIGRRELRSKNPDRLWLEAIICGLGHSDDPGAAELLVSIFERCNLPGPVRGDAGDKLGCNGHVQDRRRALYRRCRNAALKGLPEESISVQFWSMYVIASLCNVRGSRKPADKAFRAALPRLREIAAHDRRLAPGFWWPMSAEAEDAIACAENGIVPHPEAAERWLGNTECGIMTDE